MKLLHPYSVCFLLSFFLFQTIGYSQYNIDVAAKILVSNDVEHLQLKAKASNISEITRQIRYVFSTIKKDVNNNTSKNDQNGEAVIVAGASEIVSIIDLKINKNQTVIVILLIYDDADKLIGKDRWSINEKSTIKKITATKEDVINVFNGIETKIKDKKVKPKPVLKQKEEQPYDGITLSGIVTESTKTKPGRDFYRMFYSEYQLKDINAEEIVSINEKFAQGRNTIIEVKVGRQIVSQFFSRPSNDFLKSMSKNAIVRVEQYLQKLRTQSQRIRGY